MLNRLKRFWPKTILWRLTFLNVLIIATTILISSWALYHTACFLVEGIGDLEASRQTRFNTTLFQYLLLFSVVGIIVGSLIHFYLIKKIIKPIKQLIAATKQLQKGQYPDPVQTDAKDELGELTGQYNAMIKQLQANDAHRTKLISDVSHELRTPLANLNGYLRALKDGVVDGDADLYAALYAESTRMTSMLEQLEQLKALDHVTKQTMTTTETVYIAEQIQQCVTMFEWALVQADIEMKTNIENTQMAINIEDIQQVLSNVIENAIRYYQGSGAIVIEGKLVNDMYRIAVTGPSQPILKSEAKHIFDRFYRQEASRSRETGGSGLGLAISKQIMINHGGDIGFEQEAGQTTFWLTLPRS